MKITPDRLAVARAVQAEYLRSWVEPSHRSAAATLALDILIESLPEPPDDSPATLPVDPLQSFDASVWAREFRRIAISLGYSDMDEDWLIG